MYIHVGHVARLGCSGVRKTLQASRRPKALPVATRGTLQMGSLFPPDRPCGRADHSDCLGDARVGTRLARVLRAVALSACVPSSMAQGPATVTPRNPSAEEVVAGRPAGWGLYVGQGKAELQSSTDARTGGRSACLNVMEPGLWQDQPYINCGLVFGDSDGYLGNRAIRTQPNTLYRVSFWLKGTVPSVQVSAVCWTGQEAGSADRHAVRAVPGAITPDGAWTRYAGTFQTPPATVRLAIKWQVAGFLHAGMHTGQLLVDDVKVTQVGTLTGRDRRPIVIPPKANVTVFGKAVEDVVAAFDSGDEATRKAVAAAVAAADRWAAKNDSWYLERAGKHTPLGMWTLACPFHPERVRDFSKDNFQWSIDDPWKLTCDLCKTEGRPLFFYPNQRYPDSGTGCYPADAVWAADHDAAWSDAHGGIPHERWDGKPHGYSSSGYCYHFLGKCSHEIMTYMAKHTLPHLAQAYVLTANLDVAATFPPERYAHAVKVALLSLARAHLGDEYLSAVGGLRPAQFSDLMADFYTGLPRETSTAPFPGYQPYDLFDGIRDDPDHPAKRRTDIYGDGSYRGDAYARGWLRAYALVRDSFTPQEEPVRGMIERLLVSAPGDGKALASAADGRRLQLKPGKLELAVKPYTMGVGASNNLGGRALANQFDLGVLLGDSDIVGAVVSNVWFYLRNYFNGDGLGRETSPAYTNCAWSSMWQIFPKLYGYRGHYDATHPWWDPELGGLNPYADPVMKHDVAKIVFSLFPDGTMVPWMDSHAWVRPTLRYVDLAANEGGGLPDDYRATYTESRSGGRVKLLPRAQALPSMLLHESKKAVLRSGAGPERVLLSVDYAPDTGHWHPAPVDLILFAKGHELATDLGYFGAMHWLTKDWIKTCPAHNTCLIRDADGSHEFMHDVQGEVRTIACTGPGVQAVEVCERDPEHLARIPGEAPLYQRTCVLVPVGAGDTQPDRGAEHYVVDIVRVRGGAWHDYMLHSVGRECRVEGVPLDALAPDLSLDAASGFTPTATRPTGSGLITHLRRGTTSQPFQVTWRTVPDFRVTPPSVDREVALRLTVLGENGTDVFLGQAPGQRRLSNVDRDEVLHVLCVRRANAATVDRFVTVLEPYRDRPFIRSVERVDLGDDTQDAVALKVTLGARTDVIVSMAHPADTPATLRMDVGGNTRLETDALLTVLSLTESGPTDLTVCGGTHASAGDLRVTQAPQMEGELADFRNEPARLTVKSSTPLPTDATLSGRVITVSHHVDTSTFTIDRVEAAGNGSFHVHLKWSPHLYQNLLEVTEVAGPAVAVEPPPSLPRGFGGMGYAVYRLLPDKRHRLVGMIDAAQGGTLVLSADEPGLKTGDTVGVTKLRVGSDRFTILPLTVVSQY